MPRPDPLPAHGGGRRWLAWSVFVLVLLTHGGAVLLLRDLLHRKDEIISPEPIEVSLIEAPEAPAEAASAQPPEPAAAAPSPQPPAPPSEPLPSEPVARPREPLPPPPPEPVAEPPPLPVPVPEAIAPAPPAPPAPVSEPAPAIAAAPTPPGPPSVAPAPAAPADVPAAGPPTPPSYQAAYLDNPKPAYPLSARRRGLEGTVRLRVLVNAAGTVDEVQLHQTSGAPALDRSALEAVKQWRFVPAREGERAVPAWVIVPIVFTLKG